MLRRRDVLKLGSLAAAGAMVGCGDESSPAVTEDNVVHLLPTASADRILLKASFLEVPESTPELLVDGTRVPGQQTDADGEFFVFDAEGLDPGREYQLDLRVGRVFQTEPWTLRTLPARDADPERLRILAYTCAGGHELMPIHLTTAVRKRMLQRGLSFEPDVVVANGDHVYWDLTHGLSALLLGNSDTAREIAGTFDRSIPVLGTENEGVLKRAVDNQIVELYGNLFRSVPYSFSATTTTTSKMTNTRKAHPRSSPSRPTRSASNSQGRRSGCTTQSSSRTATNPRTSRARGQPTGRSV